jgi:fructosamine-3-kinase
VADLALHGANLLRGELRHVQPLGGGSLSELVRIVLADGRIAIVKGGPTPQREAAMLAALRASSVPTPEVYAFDERALVLEVLSNDGALASAWSGLGNVLTTLHQSEGGHYGWTDDYAFGPLTIINHWSDNWPCFWADNRLLCHTRYVGTTLSVRLEKLCSDLVNRLPQNPKPSLLHGDLWSGNVLVADREISGLIDPACYYGHNEVDIAMLMMFDQPGDIFFSAYKKLEAGHEERLRIYRLWSALVHLRLFGIGYRSLVERLLTELGV